MHNERAADRYNAIYKIILFFAVAYLLLLYSISIDATQINGHIIFGARIWIISTELVDYQYNLSLVCYY